jgi:hypothetical protein
MTSLCSSPSGFERQSNEGLDEVSLIRDHGIRVSSADVTVARRAAPEIRRERLIGFKRNLAVATGAHLDDLKLAARAAKIPLSEIGGATRTF